MKNIMKQIKMLDLVLLLKIRKMECTMSSFERYMVNRLDSFAENQRNLHDLCISNFQSIDNRFNSMNAHFMNLD